MMCGHERLDHILADHKKNLCSLGDIAPDAPHNWQEGFAKVFSLG